MNILRWKRKSKIKIKLKTFMLFIFSLIMTTFAWFAYSKILDTNLNIHMVSWDIKYYMGTGEDRVQKTTNPIPIEINNLYPAMPEHVQTVYIENNGEALVDIEYHVASVTIVGQEYTLIQEGQAVPTEPDAKYIVLTPSSRETEVIGVDEETGYNIIREIVKGTITNDITKLPFTIEVEHSAQVDPITDSGEPGEGYLKVIVNWIGDNDELDSEWGYIVGEYLNDKPAGTPAMTIELKIDSYQANPLGEVITETLPSTSETTPFLPTGFTRLAGTTLDTGLVIKDSSGNQYVWIEVPKSAGVYATAGLTLDLDNLTGDELTNAYSKIETDLKTYATTFRNGTTYSDNYPSTIVYASTGLNFDSYNALKKDMLKCTYKNGGFYIGRYETGIETGYRSSSGSTPQTPVIKSNAYPYNYVTCEQAQSLASEMDSGQYTSSIMFGIQWDLMLKYLQNKGVGTSLLNSNSTTFGNYNNNLYYITNSKAKYYNTDWAEVPYEKTKDGNILLSTGANTLFSRKNVSDIAGNLWEWTLEYSYITGTTSVYRGGAFNEIGSSTPSSKRKEAAPANSLSDVGFRVTIY